MGDRTDRAERDRFRRLLMSRVPEWYSPWLHLLLPALVGACVVIAALRTIHAPRPLQWLVIPLTWIISNAFEWRVHRDVLHRRVPLLHELYERHTPEHHRVFITDDMAIRSWRELRLVLIPAIGVIGIVAIDMAIALGLAQLLSHNVAALFLVTSVSYTLSYEWLHLCYHLPEHSWVGRRRLIQRLRRHHALHHHPERMQRWNFNVTVPLWDWLRGTIYPEGKEHVPTAQT